MAMIKSSGAEPIHYVRFESVHRNQRGYFTGVFGLVNTLAKQGRLTDEQESFRRSNNDWYNEAYLSPSTVDPTVYDHEVNPGAAAWFKPSATHLIERVPGYLEILTAHGVEFRTVRSAAPGRVIYEDEVQVVVVPRGRESEMENVRYYFKVSEVYTRSNPGAVMRRYEVNGITYDEVYRFNGQGWSPTEFFQLYRLGHNDDDYIEVPQEEAEEAIEAKLRRGTGRKAVS
nr:hypothetical protein [Glycomyces buryatensis]